MLRGVALVGIKDVQWLVLPALRKSFRFLVKALTILGQGADDIADEAIKTKPSTKTTVRPSLSLKTGSTPPSTNVSHEVHHSILWTVFFTNYVFCRNKKSNLKSGGLSKVISDATTTTTTFTKLPSGQIVETVEGFGVHQNHHQQSMII